MHITATGTLIGDKWVLYSTFDSIDSDTIITLSATTRVMHMAGLYWRNFEGVWAIKMDQIALELTGVLCASWAHAVIAVMLLYTGEH